ncbi:MAG: hypothetical protein QG646_4524, partial [Euryarchaeota archaeon]|nr:hypothetical protein [Euryarchaeota archaeon]
STLAYSNPAGSSYKTTLATLKVKYVATVAAPIANFTVSSTSGNVPLTVQIVDASTGGVSSYAWDFNNDGTIDSTQQSPLYTYNEAGIYSVNLTVANSVGIDSEVKTGYIVVSGSSSVAPIANFTATPTSGNAPLTVQFTDASTGTVSSYAWDFNNDGTVDNTEKSPSYTYSAAGTYTVNLTVNGQDGSDSEVKTAFIVVNNPVPTSPVANFTAAPVLGTKPLNVQFTDISTGTPTSWKWSFGDGTYSTKQNPSHIYSKRGKYTVSLTVKNTLGRNTIKKTNYIDVEVFPVANFLAYSTVGKVPMKVKFIDKSRGDPTSWNWDFGDGNTSTEQNPTNVYGAVGRYNVTLTVTNAAGTNSTTKYGYIDVEASLVAEFSASSTLGVRPLNVQFTDMSVGVPTSWKWSFGDGSYSSKQNPSHIYKKGGKYTVSLTVINTVGRDTTKKTNYITIEVPPVSYFSASPKAGKAPLNVVFTDKSTGYPESWKWDFGDGNISTEQKPTHIYSTAGRYTVKLTVSNLAGSNTKSMVKYIKVS